MKSFAHFFLTGTAPRYLPQIHLRTIILEHGLLSRAS